MDLCDRSKRAVVGFRRKEDGSLLIFGLFCFVMMLFLAGAALDLMRFEERRTTLQNTIDRAVLAAADLHQTLPPKDVVKDYFLKAGLTPPSDADIVINQGNFNEWRTVQANVREEMPTWFMNMVGVNSLSTPGSGTAEERVGQVEVSLVLDVSGSMNSGSRLTNLKPAASSFIDQMFDTVEPGKLSISIVTYSTQVALGTGMLQYFHNTAEQTASTCLEFTTADYSTRTLSPKSTPVGSPAASSDRQYQLNGHFEPFNTITNTSSSWLPNCPTETNRRILAYSGSRTALKAYIAALTAKGNTSIDIGMKWGVGLLDPSMAPVVTRMIAAGTVPSAFSERPYAYTNREALKVVVIMTDGENTTEYQLRDAYDHGLSRLYRNTSNNSAVTSGVKRYSLYDATRSSNKYYSFYTNAWRAAPFGANASDYTGDNTDTYVQMTWPEVWSAMSVNYFADYIISPIYGSTERNRWRTSASNATATTSIASTKDAQTLAICSAAKQQGIKVFTIGFDAPSAGQSLLLSCATSQAHTYAATGSSIASVFSSIASSINKLRLTH